MILQKKWGSSKVPTSSDAEPFALGPLQAILPDFPGISLKNKAHLKNGLQKGPANHFLAGRPWLSKYFLAFPLVFQGLLNGFPRSSNNFLVWD